MKVRVLRLLEYYGEEEAVRDHLEKRGVVGYKPVRYRDANNEGHTVAIRECMLGEFPIPLPDPPTGAPTQAVSKESTE